MPDPEKIIPVFGIFLSVYGYRDTHIAAAANRGLWRKKRDLTIKDLPHSGLHAAALFGALLGALALAGCGGTEISADGSATAAPHSGAHAGARSTGVPGPDAPGGLWRGGQPHPAPRMVTARAPLQCVPFARRHVKISLRGDAWTWWNGARGRYDRGSRPRPGAVLVLKRRGNSRGHVAVVTRVAGPREIIVDHANWLNRGRIHLGTPVRDVSPNNDWSAVRVWYTPGRSWGRTAYPAYGFIYPAVGES